MSSILLAAAGTMASEFKLALSNHTLGSEDLQFDSYSSTLTVGSNGQLSIDEDGSVENVSGEWGVPVITGVGDDYEVMLEKTSGDNPTSGTLGSWLSLSTNKGWSWSVTGSGSRDFEGTLSIGRAGESTALVSATITVSFTVAIS